MINRLSLSLLVLNLICLASSAVAQINEEAFEQVPLITESEQISDILDIIQDREGYIWVGTDQGLLRLHGTSHTLYQNDPDNPQSLPHNHVTALLEDPAGVIWVGTRSGLFQFHQDCDCFGTFARQYDIGKINGHVADLELDTAGNIWIAFVDQGLFKYDRDEDRFLKCLDDPNNSVDLSSDIINDLLVDQDNRIWIGTGKGYSGNGIVLFDPESRSARRFTHIPGDNASIKDDRIGSLLSDDQGRIFAGTYQCALHLYRPETQDFEELTSGNQSDIGIYAPYSAQRIHTSGYSHNVPHVELLYQDTKGGYWVGTPGKGLYYFADAMSSPARFMYDSDETGRAPNNIFKCIYEDRQGVLWIGCEGGVLYRKDIYAPVLQYYPDMYASEMVHESPYQSSEIWAGSEGGGLRRFNLVTSTLTTYMHDPDDPRSIRHNSVRNVYQESPDVLWVGVGSIGGDDGGEDGLGGLERLDLRTSIFKHFDISSNSSGDSFSHTVYNIVEDRSGRLWLSAGAGGIYRSNSAKDEFRPFDVFVNNHKIDRVIIFDLGLMPDGRLWISGVLENDEKNLLIFDQSSNQFNTIAESELGTVTNVVSGQPGYLWMSTWSQGVLKFDMATGAITRFTVDDGLPSNQATYIIRGEQAQLWIGTRYGVCRLDLATEEITSIDLDDIWFYLGAAMTSDGRLFFSTKTKGLVSFFSDEIAGNPYPPETAISRITIADEEFHWNTSELLTLNHSQNDVIIEFDCLHFAEPAKNRFAYQLMPLNDDWIEIGSEQNVQFQNLAPGKYSFRAKSANEGGIWSTENAAFNFRILTPPWKTGWAYFLYVLVITGVLYTIYRFTLRQQLAQQEAQRLIELDAFKDKFYTNITHEFRTPLTVIEGMADEISRHPERHLEKNLSLIKKNSRKLLNLVNQMLELSRLNAGKVKTSIARHDVIGHLKHTVEMYASFARRHGVGLQFYSDEDSLLMDTDLRLLEQAVTNILSNAIKFTPEHGNVLVVTKTSENSSEPQLHILVKDTGVGIPAEEMPFIFDRFHRVPADADEQNGTGIGLALTREIIQLLEGRIDVESTLGKGTTVHIYLPILQIAQPAAPQEHTEVKQTQSETSAVELNDHDLPRILIIEDNRDVIEYLQMSLGDKYGVVTAFDGREGLDKAFEVLPDIIITDVMMPEMDGYEVCAQLKQDPRTDHIPVIMLTARVATDDRLHGLKQGADAYLAKPFEREELMIRLKNLLEVRERLQQKYSTSLASEIPPASPQEKTIHTFVQQVENIILDHLDNESFSIDLLASEVQLSKSQLHRKIKSLTGKSTSVYVRSVRLHKSKEFLRTTDMNVSEVAYAVGFNSPVYFSQAFKEAFGVSPSKFSG